MATISTAGLGLLDEQLEKLGRIRIRAIIEAGSRGAQAKMRDVIQRAGHVRNGDLLRSVQPTELHERLGGGYQYVKPEGYNPAGDVREETIAWKIDNGKKGDHFLRNAWDEIQAAGEDAMAAEADRQMAEISE